MNADKSRVMVSGSVCKVIVDSRQVEHESELKYLGCVLD